MDNGEQPEHSNTRPTLIVYTRRRVQNMARFSIGRDDDDHHHHGEGPSNNPITTTAANTIRIPKRPRINPPSTSPPPTPPPPPHPYPENVEEVVEAADVGVGQNEHEDDSVSEFEEDHAMLNEGQEAEDGGSGLANDLAGVDGSSSFVSVTLTDPDVLDCPICLDTLSIPVFQCENGHIACASCCTKIANKCPSCSWPIGYNRCRAIEKVLESVRIWCRNMPYGCRLRMPYSKKCEHENSCIYAPCSCPLDSCNFVDFSKRLYSHFRMSHSNVAKSFRFNSLFPVSLEKNQKNVILQEQTEGIIFVVNHSSQRMGSAVNVMCIGSAALPRKEFYYDIICRDGDSSLKLQASAENVLKLPVNLPGKKFLLVPNDFISSGGRLKLEVCIRRHHESSSCI